MGTKPILRAQGRDEFSAADDGVGNAIGLEKCAILLEEPLWHDFIEWPGLKRTAMII